MADDFTRIPDDIDRELSPKARKFVQGLIGEVVRLRRENAALRKRVEELEARNRALEARIAELEAKLLKLTPQNSSLPPSTVHPHARLKLVRPKVPRGGKR